MYTKFTHIELEQYHRAVSNYSEEVKNIVEWGGSLYLPHVDIVYSAVTNSLYSNCYLAWNVVVVF